MRCALITVVLLVAVTGANAAGADKAEMQRLWFEAELTVEERTELVETSKKREAFDVVAPLVLEVMIESRPQVLFSWGGEEPWNDGHPAIPGGFSEKQRKYIMATEVWNHHVSLSDDPKVSRTNVLLELLDTEREGEPTDACKEKARVVIRALRHTQWTEAAENALVAIAGKEGHAVSVRHVAARVLLDRVEINMHFHLALRVIRAHESARDRRDAFTSVLNQGNRLFELNKANKHTAARLGFRLLKLLPDDKLQQGYVLARSLGFLLEQPQEFAPDQDAPKYQGEHGLNDAFFIDTVKNALDWYERNRSRLPRCGEGQQRWGWVTVDPGGEGLGEWHSGRVRY